MTRFRVQWFWFYSLLLCALIGIVFPQIANTIIIWAMTGSILVPATYFHYLSFCNKASSRDFSSLQTMFFVYSFLTLFLVFPTNPFPMIMVIAIIVILLVVEIEHPNWLYELRNKFLKK